jgi:AraC-like DNA-binding protein
MHLVFRLSDHPLRLFNDISDPIGYRVGHTILGGARAAFYMREISAPVCSVGAQLHAGTAELLFGAPAREFAGRHTPVEDLWGSYVEEVRERLMESGDPHQLLDVFESLLAERLPAVRALHPAVAEALSRFRASPDIRQAVKESGYSHRRFIALFHDGLGLTPKLYCRLKRFQGALEQVAVRPAASLVDVALEAGYSDQAHFNREFREFAGVSPGEYRELSPAFPHHVPIPDPQRQS